MSGIARGRHFFLAHPALRCYTRLLGWMGMRRSISGAAGEGMMPLPAHPATVQYTNYVYPKGEVCPARHEMAFAKVLAPAFD